MGREFCVGRRPTRLRPETALEKSLAPRVSVAKTWLSIRNRISPVLYVLYIPLYRMIECSFGFLSESIDCEQKSLDFGELEIEANAVLF